MENSYFLVTALLILLNTFVAGTPSSCPSSVAVIIGEKVTFKSVIKPQAVSKLDTSYDSQGLEPFFNLARSFMNTVQPKPFPDFTDAKGKIKFNWEADKDKLIKYEIPIGVAIGFGVLFALLLPIVGLCFCCCRCCNKCGGEMIQSDEDANNHTKCCICSFILFLITVFMLCGVLFMFVTNNRLKTEVEGGGSTYIKAIDELISYANNTLDEVTGIVPTQLDCAIDLILDDISITGLRTHVGKPIQDAIKPHVIGPLDLVKDATQNVTEMSTSLDKVTNATKELRSRAAGLGNDLDNVRSELLSILANCSVVPVANTSCSKVDSNGLNQEANFSALPNVDQELGNIKKILNQNLTGKVDEGRKVFDDIPQTVLDKTTNIQKDINKLAEDAKGNIANQTEKLTKSFRKSIVDEKGKFYDYRKNYTDKYLDYDRYRFYAGCGIAGYFTLILLLLAIGLTCGICGYKRESNPTQRGSVPHHGGNCLMASVGFMFFLAFELFLLTAVFFAVGEHLHIFCREVKDGKLIDQYAGSMLKYNGTQISMEQLLKDCRNNEPVYKAAGAEKFFDFDEKLNVTKKLGNIDEQLDKFNVNLTDQSILNPETKTSLNDLANSSVDKINFTKFFDELSKKIVQADLIVLANNLTTLSTTLRATNLTQAEELANRTDAVATELKRIQYVVIANISATVDQLKLNVKVLQEKANDLSVVAKNILSKLEAADAYVKFSASADIVTIVKAFSKRVIGWAEQFAEQKKKEIKNNLAKCKPIANLYDGLINTYICKGIIGNFNGFWLAMGWCLFFFIPAIICGVKLAKYYRRMNYMEGFDRRNQDDDAYPGYSNGHADKIPLQNMPPAYHLPERRDFVPLRAQLRVNPPRGQAPPPYSDYDNKSFNIDNKY